MIKIELVDAMPGMLGEDSLSVFLKDDNGVIRKYSSIKEICNKRDEFEIACFNWIMKHRPELLI